tara:strand:+ start:8048 stop:8545 length:498 start_codon:yes stop_codon:yes gene_type:complete
MGGKALGGKKITNEEAVNLFNKIMTDNDLISKTDKIMLCGSARRKKDTCGDLDVVFIDDENNSLKAWLASEFGYQKNGKAKIKGLVEGVQVEFYEATPPTWGSTTLMWTGPAFSNIRMRKASKKNGWKMSQYGIKDESGKNLTENMTEESIYELLGMSYRVPEKR